MLVSKLTETPDKRMEVVVVGIGGAGLQVLDRLVLRGLQEVRMIALDTDSRKLGSSVVEEKIQLGQKLTRGLDSGGDPEVGARSVVETSEQFVSALGDAKLVFLIAGLGGGTGTGGIAELARLARSRGAKVVSLVTLPFEFEGRRRAEQAQDGLDDLVTESDALYVLPNDVVMSIVGEGKSVFEAFEVSDDVLGQISRGLCHLLAEQGFLSIEWAELVKMLEPSVREPGRSCWVGWGEDVSENRAREVVDMVLEGPFLSQQELRNQADEVLVSITGGVNMLFSEVDLVVRELRMAFPPSANLRLATRLDPERGDELSVLVIAAKTLLKPLPGLIPRQTPAVRLPVQRVEERKPEKLMLPVNPSPVSTSERFVEAIDLSLSKVASEQTAQLEMQAPPVGDLTSTIHNEGIRKPTEQPVKSVITESVKDNATQPEAPPPAQDDLFSSQEHDEYDEETLRNLSVRLGIDEKPEHGVEGRHITTIFSDANFEEKNTMTAEENNFLAEKNLLLDSDVAQKNPGQSLPDIELENVDYKAESVERQEQQTGADFASEASQNTADYIHPDVQEEITKEVPPVLPKVEFAAITQPLRRVERLDKTQIIRPLPLDTRPGSPAQKNLHRPAGFDAPKVQQENAAASKEVFYTHNEQSPEPVTTKMAESRQETLQFDTAPKGRFEKTDATVHNGENLDVPTFIRKQFRIRQVTE